MANSESQDENERHHRRVDQILRRARHEVGVRDLLTFFGARIWTVALDFGALVYALLGKWQTGRGEPEQKK